MRYYSIDIDGQKLAGCKNTKEMFDLRKRNLRITQVFWIVVGIDTSLMHIDALYPKQTMVLIWLN